MRNQKKEEFTSVDSGALPECRNSGKQEVLQTAPAQQRKRPGPQG